MPHYALDVRILPEAVRSINSAAFTGAYQALGVPTTKPIRIIKFYNDSNVDVTVSWDGVLDHDVIPTKSWIVYPITASETVGSGSQGIYIKKGTQFYVKGAAGIGLFYLSCIG